MQSLKTPDTAAATLESWCMSKHGADALMGMLS